MSQMEQNKEDFEVAMPVGNDRSSILDHITTSKLQEFDRDLDAVVEMLQMKEDVPNARIPEDIFRRAYLPMFAGIPEEKWPVAGITLNNWYGVSGGPHFEVDVIDTKGNVLFTVPPIVPPPSTRAMAKFAEDGHGVGSAFNKAREVGRNIPIEGEIIARQEVQRIQPRFSRRYENDYRMRWAPIFGYYGFLSNVKPTIDVASYYYGSREEAIKETNTGTSADVVSQLDDLWLE